MPDTAWPLIETDDARALAARADLDDLDALLTPDMKAGALITKLREAGRDYDAIKALSQALPGREAVWWACRCLRTLPAPAKDSPEARALNFAEQWALEPSEDLARQAYAAAQELEFRRPHAWAGAAALWAGPNMNPIAGLPPVPPDPSLVGKAAAGAIGQAAASDDPPKPAERHKQFLAIGEAVASGADSWKQHIG